MRQKKKVKQKQNNRPTSTISHRHTGWSPWSAHSFLWNREDSNMSIRYWLKQMYYVLWCIVGVLILIFFILNIFVSWNCFKNCTFYFLYTVDCHTSKTSLFHYYFIIHLIYDKCRPVLHILPLYKGDDEVLSQIAMDVLTPQMLPSSNWWETTVAHKYYST